MKRPCLLFLALCCASFAQDITVSKDSIRVYNSSFSSFADEVIFTSHTSTPVRLDSVIILIAEMDTAGFTVILARKLMQVEWEGNYSSTQQFAFSGTGTTSQMFLLQIGSCFQCNSLPEYPRYIRGTMSLFFSNGQVVELKLWSQDLRTGVKAKNFSTPQLLNSRRFGVPEGVSTSSPSYRYLANGRKIIAAVKQRCRRTRLGRLLY